MKIINNAQKVLDQKYQDKISIKANSRKQKMNKSPKISTVTIKLTNWMNKNLIKRIKNSIVAFVIIGH